MPKSGIIKMRQSGCMNRKIIFILKKVGQSGVWNRKIVSILKKSASTSLPGKFTTNRM